MRTKFYWSHPLLALALTLALLPSVEPASASRPIRACFPPPDGLTAWWPGDGNADEIVSGKNGEFHDSAGTAPGLVGNAFLLDGDSDFISVPHDEALNLGSGDFTVDFWVYFNDTAGEQVMVEKWVQSFSGPSQGWTLTKLEDNVVRLATSSGEGDDVNVDSIPLSIPANTWLYFAATRKAGQVTIFMNGKLVASGEASLNLDSDSSLKFGHRGNPFDTPGSEDERGFYLNGQIDEVQLFVGRALPRGLIQAIFKAGSAGKCKDAFQPPPRLNLRGNYGDGWVESLYEAGTPP